MDWILSVCGRANKGDDDAAAHPQMLFAPDDLFVVTDNHFFAMRWARDCGPPRVVRDLLKQTEEGEAKGGREKEEAHVFGDPLPLRMST